MKYGIGSFEGLRETFPLDTVLEITTATSATPYTNSVAAEASAPSTAAITRKRLEFGSDLMTKVSCADAQPSR